MKDRTGTRARTDGTGQHCLGPGIRRSAGPSETRAVEQRLTLQRGPGLNPPQTDALGAGEVRPSRCGAHEVPGAQLDDKRGLDLFFRKSRPVDREVFNSRSRGTGASAPMIVANGSHDSPLQQDRRPVRTIRNGGSLRWLHWGDPPPSAVLGAGGTRRRSG